MSFAKTYEEAKERYKPMRRTRMQRSEALSKPRQEGRLSKTTTLKRGKSKPSRTRRDPQHEAWRNEVLERDGHRCRWIDPSTKKRCSRRGKSLHAHHIRERTQRPDLRYDVKNGATLCGEHHDYAHHNAQGRKEATAQGLLGGETYEAAQKARDAT